MLKTLAAIFMFSFVASSSVEGRVHRTHPQTSSIKKKTPTKPAPTRSLSPQRKKQVVTQRSSQRPLAAKRPQTSRALSSTRTSTTAQVRSQKTTPVNKRQVIAKKIPACLVYYKGEGEGHGLDSPVALRDAMNEMLTWMKTYGDKKEAVGGYLLVIFS